ncbi:MAG TPA: hypothetical protein VIC54_08785 [Terriglobales bacterium]
MGGTAQGTIAGQVTSSSGTAGTAADVTLSALQAVSVGGSNLSLTIPLVQQHAATANVATASGATCAVNTDCANYSLAVPALAPTTGTFAASGTSYTVGTAAAAYSVEAQAAVPSSGGTADCTPSVLTTPTGAGASLTVTAGATVQAAVLSFTGCQ